MSGRGPEYERLLLSLQLVLRTVHVVGQHPGRRGSDAMSRLEQVDPESAERILAQYERITWTPCGRPTP